MFTKQSEGEVIMKYGIGIDVGIASVGWAVLSLDDEHEPKRIIRFNSHIFKAAEHPKDGSSLASPRRLKRGTRRRLRRKSHRIERIRKLIVNENLLTSEMLEALYNGQLSDIYELRVDALDRKISDEEFARLLIHLAQRRGFRSNRKKDKEDTETGKVLSAISKNAELMKEKEYRTVGEMLLNDARFAGSKRNKGENYLSTIQREMVSDEVNKIFSAQRSFSNAKATEKLEENYLEILLSQRSFESGPASGPYSGDQIWKMVGNCSFEPEKKRAAKATYSFEYFNLLQKVNHIRLAKSGDGVPLTTEQREKVLALSHKSANISYASIRKELSIPLDTTFNISYRGKLEECEKKEKFIYLKAYHDMKKAFDKLVKGHINSITVSQRNGIALAFTVHKTDDKIIESLNGLGLSKEEINILIEHLPNFSGFGSLSIEACDKLIPFLQQGMTYDKACAYAGYDFKGHANENRDELISLKHLQESAENITSPVVKRSLSQTAKVINAIIREQGSSPSFINIELARELSKLKKDRDKLDKDMKENRAKNQRIMDRIRNDFGKVNPTGMDLVKLKLYEEQAGVCPYSVTQIDISRLFEAGYVDVDHIVPYSKSFDDSYTNKVLVLTSENREKGNRLPLEYLNGDKRDKFIVWAKNNVRNQNKLRNLLKEEITEDDLSDFKERNLTDTKTISRFLFNYLRDNLKMDEDYPRKNQINPVNGAVTSAMRKRWGLNKIREDGDLHHAVDAVAVAAITPSLIKSVTSYSRKREIEYMPAEDGGYMVSTETGEILEHFPEPWKMFRKELEARLSGDPKKVLSELKLLNYSSKDIDNACEIFVSRTPRRKVTGEIHEETVRSPKAIEQGLKVSKVPLEKLKLDKKTGEIENYYMPQSDTLLYNALKLRLELFEGKREKAFTEPFYKPKSDGSQGPLVKKVKIQEKATLTVPVHSGSGIADNGGMIRVDVFFVEKDGYYIVPVYRSDVLKENLPSKAVVAHKPYAEWKEMKDEDFIFSLYPDDLFYAEHKTGFNLSIKNKESSLPKEIKSNSGFFYYTGANISTAAISGENHDSSYFLKGIGVKTLANFEKYQVDVLGNKSKVKKETRMSFSNKKS